MFKSWFTVLIIFALVSIALPACADGIDKADANGIDNAALKKLLDSGDATPVDDDMLRLTTNKDKLIRLDQDATSVVVNNPEHAQVILDSPRLLIVMPRQPGATSFSVLDADGKTILHKEIIVSNVEPHYVRIRRMCQGGGDCAPVSYYYCPNGCYEVTAINQGGGNVPPPPAAPRGAGQQGDNGDQLAPPQNPIKPSTMSAPATPGGGL